MISKFQRSQNAHKRLIDKYDGSQYGFFGGSKSDLTKFIYHKNVYLEQDLHKRILSKQQKRDLYKFALSAAKD